MRRQFRLIVTAATLAGGLLVPVLTQAASASATITTKTYTPAATFSPKTAAKAGSTDVYHCTLIDPHINVDSFVVGSQFLPTHAKELHHEISFLIPPDKVALARQLNRGGKGWGCFGAPLNPSGSFDGTTWLGGWAPGGKPSRFTDGTGIAMPKGSLIVEQVHYNLLAGSTPDRSGVRISTTPQKGSSLKALTMIKMVAPPDLPCPTGITGPLCDRTASLADLGSRFGDAAVGFVNNIEGWCHLGDPGGAAGAISRIKQPAFGKTVKTVCSTPPGASPGSVIRQVTPHLHLTGWGVKIQLVSGSKTTTLVNVPSYNFDSQLTYNLAKPVTIKAGDMVKMTCSYSPSIRTGLGLQTRYVTWGDGSSDEMCLGIIGTTPH